MRLHENRGESFVREKDLVRNASTAQSAPAASGRVALKQLRAPLVSAVALLLLAAGCSDAPVRAHWAQIEAEPRSALIKIRVSVGSTSCDSIESIRVTESAKTVTIRAFVRQKRHGHDCTEDCGLEDRVVRLRRPLGDRQLTGGESERRC